MGTRTFKYGGVDLDGFDLSGVDADGVEFHVETFTGWTGSPGSNIEVTQKPAAHGGWASNRPRFKPRVLTITGYIHHRDAALVAAASDNLNAAVSLDPFRLNVTDGGRTRYVNAQRSDDVLIDDSLATTHRYSMQLVAKDPAKYAAPIVGSTGLPATSGGLAVPLSIPFGIDSLVVSGQVSAFNPGTLEGRVIIRIDGPISSPTVTHTGPTGITTTFSSSVTLISGEWLDLDVANKRFLGNGQVSRAEFITSRGWALFKPGANTWSLTSGVGKPSPLALLTVSATPAWR